MRLLQPWMKADNVSVIDVHAEEQRRRHPPAGHGQHGRAPWHAFDIDDKTDQWIANAKKLGFKLCIISNNKKWRIQKLAALLDVHGVGAPASL